jgi:hypothetical protein
LHDGFHCLRVSQSLAKDERGKLPEGPCHEAFLSISGVRLVSRLTLIREPGGRRFTPAERALADLVHAESVWIYPAGSA